MIKYLKLSFLVVFFSGTLFAQQSAVSTHDLTEFNRAVELYKDKQFQAAQIMFDKIKNKQELSEYEKKDFYDLVNLAEPVRLYRGIKYDFREILVKVKNVHFWTISEKPNKEEKRIYKSGNVYADWTLD